MSYKTIVVNDIAASTGGALTVLNEFYDAVKRSGKSARWVFILSDKYIEEDDNIQVVAIPKAKSHLNRIVFDLISGHRLINSCQPDLVFSLQNTIVNNCEGKSVIYLHQPIPFQKTVRYSFIKPSEFNYACIQYGLGALIKRSVRKADLTIVQTRWMKEAVKRECGVNNVRKISPSAPCIKEKAQYDTTRVFFYPTSDVPYKNNELLVKACEQLCREGVDFTAFLTTNVQASSCNAIQSVGRLPVNQVYECYAESCLVFPSYIETFGYPLIEARTVGSIILASDCSFSRELLDGYQNAYFFNPFSVDELHDLMLRVANGTIRRKENSQDAYDGVNQQSTRSNTWDEVVIQLIEFMA